MKGATRNSDVRNCVDTSVYTREEHSVETEGRSDKRDV